MPWQVVGRMQVFMQLDKSFILIRRSHSARSVANGTQCLLPTDIRIVGAEYVDENFHARYSAIGKTYRL